MFKVRELCIKCWIVDYGIEGDDWDVGIELSVLRWVV